MTPRITMPSHGGLKNPDWKFQRAGTAANLKQSLQQYRQAALSESSLPLRHERIALLVDRVVQLPPVGFVGPRRP